MLRFEGGWTITRDTGPGDGQREETSPATSDLPLAAEVAMLTAELDRLRQDRNNSWTIYTSLVGVAVVLAGGFLALSDRELASSVRAEAWIWAAFALIPPMVASFVAWTSAREVIQSYYTREVERRLAALWAHNGTGPSADALPPTMLETVDAALTGNRRGMWQIRVIFWTELFVLASIMFGGSLVAARRVEIDALRWFTTTVVVSIAAVTAHLAYRLMARGADTWEAVRAHAIDDLRSPFPRQRRTRDERRLVSYLLLPRPNDLVVKGVMLHLAAAMVGAWLARDQVGWREALRFAAVSFVGFELLMYQARYMVNDLRGQADDRVSPARSYRRRLPQLEPVGSERQPRRKAVKATIALRAAAAVGVAFALPGWWRLGLLGALVATWVLAITYERLRHRPSARGPQRSPGLAFNRWAVQIYALVGLSYAIRAAFGLYLGSEGLVSVALVVAVAVTFYLGGLAVVLIAWGLETTLYVGRRSGLDVVGQDIGTKDHLLPLARSAGVLAPSAKVLGDGDPDLQEEDRIHRDKPVLATADRLSQPWNWIFVLSSASAAVAGWLGHAGVGALPTLPPAFAAAAVGTAVGLACVRWPAFVGILAPVSFVAWAMWLWESGSGFDPLFGPFPVAVVVLMYVVSRQMTYAQTVDMAGQMRSQLRDLRKEASHLAKELWR